MVHGDGFQLIAMPNGVQAQLRILNPSYIRKVSLDDDGRKLYDTQQGILGEDEVLQIMGASYDGLRGMSPIVLFLAIVEVLIGSYQERAGVIRPRASHIAAASTRRRIGRDRGHRGATQAVRERARRQERHSCNALRYRGCPHAAL